ncbi:hypothetical protein Fcan01_00293 [Folsomia candida]|uniref:Uncharacterized protein n=1 Tax=Folsomia candida TaxID=158441 RepID=A0A226F179_FOLCA|nr:hypothetical protein Fcan01_00293 [Folsomia candida]
MHIFIIFFLSLRSVYTVDQNPSENRQLHHILTSFPSCLISIVNFLPGNFPTRLNTPILLSDGYKYRPTSQIYKTLLCSSKFILFPEQRNNSGDYGNRSWMTFTLLRTGTFFRNGPFSPKELERPILNEINLNNLHPLNLFIISRLKSHNWFNVTFSYLGSYLTRLFILKVSLKPAQPKIIFICQVCLTKGFIAVTISPGKINRDLKHHLALVELEIVDNGRLAFIDFGWIGIDIDKHPHLKTSTLSPFREIKELPAGRYRQIHLVYKILLLQQIRTNQSALETLISTLGYNFTKHMTSLRRRPTSIQFQLFQYTPPHLSQAYIPIEDGSYNFITCDGISVIRESSIFIPSAYTVSFSWHVWLLSLVVLLSMPAMSYGGNLFSFISSTLENGSGLRRPVESKPPPWRLNFEYVLLISWFMYIFCLNSLYKGFLSADDVIPWRPVLNYQGIRDLINFSITTPAVESTLPFQFVGIGWTEFGMALRKRMQES